MMYIYYYIHTEYGWDRAKGSTRGMDVSIKVGQEIRLNIYEFSLFDFDDG